MSDYLYHPDFSFLARCWWQLSDELLNPDQWWDSIAELAPVWLHFGGAGIHNDKWYKYLRAEPEGEGPLQLGPEDYSRPGHVYGELFWFAAYVSSKGQAGPKLCYEIRPYDRKWKPLNRIVHHNPTVLSGYAGIKDVAEPEAGQHCLSGPSHLWSLAGLDYREIKRGARMCNVILQNAAGQRARRYANNGAWLINTVNGKPGLMALEVLDYAHEARDVAWGSGLNQIGSRYAFKPEYSFIARSWWRPDEPSAPAGLIAARFDEGVEWYPRAGLNVEAGDTLQDRWCDDETRPACDHFWFAAYVDNGACVYEIWPLDQRGRRLNFTLREQQGWRTSLAQRGEKERAEPDFLWRLVGLDPAALEEATTVTNVKLQHISGQLVKLAHTGSENRLRAGVQGDDGSLTLHILETSARS
ncbi:hypothetical protein ACJ70E_09410 [Pseudomonas plecoglossicida]|uniref:hypothetical protein n=1 Tax=Pseudomonas plecoglossicida TaxID=70775 RepID=UPI003977D022